jgi:hypothetical protein
MKFVALLFFLASDAPRVLTPTAHSPAELRLWEKYNVFAADMNTLVTEWADKGVWSARLAKRVEDEFEDLRKDEMWITGRTKK